MGTGLRRSVILDEDTDLARAAISEDESDHDRWENEGGKVPADGDINGQT